MSTVLRFDTNSQGRRVAKIVEKIWQRGEVLARANRLTDEFRLQVLREEIEVVEKRLRDAASKADPTEST